MKRRRPHHEGGTASAEDDSTGSATPASDAIGVIAGATTDGGVVAAPSAGRQLLASQPHPPGMLPLSCLVTLPMVARWTPLAIRVRMWNNERRRTLSGDKRPRLIELGEFLVTHPQYYVHPGELRVLQVLELAKDGMDGFHECHCTRCRLAFDWSKPMLGCQSCTSSWHRDCLADTECPADVADFVCSECIRRHAQVAPTDGIIAAKKVKPALMPSEKINVERSSPAKPPRNASTVSITDLNGCDSPVALPKIVPATVAKQPEAAVTIVSPEKERTDVFSRENFRLLFNFLSKLKDNGHISHHETGLMKNLIIARDAQAVVMLSIIDMVEEGGDVLDAVDSLRRILMVK